MSVSLEVVHSIPGRVRVRIPHLKHVNGFAEEFVRFMSTRQGVRQVRVNKTCATAVIHYDPQVLSLKATQRLLNRSLKAALNGNRLAQRVPHKQTPEWRPLFLSTLLLLVRWLPLPLSMRLLSLLTLLAALPTLSRAWRALVKERRLNVDVLDATAVALLTRQGSLGAAAFMVWLINLGEFIRELTARRSHRVINDLMVGQQRWAWVMRKGTKHRVAMTEVVPGETVVVYPGEAVPVDGTVIQGEAMLDQRSLTGESTPVRKGVGDKVFAATVVSDGKIYVKAEQVGAHKRAAQIVHLIETAPLQETKIENYAARIADKLVLPALLTSGVMWGLTRSVNRTLPFIIVDFGTGLRVAAPTAVLASIASVARRGVLFKSGRALEKLAQVDTIIFDKTGTLTLGEPQVVEVLSCDPQYSADAVLALAAAAEKRLTHPAAQAIVRKAKDKQLAIPERSESEYFIGLGVKAHVNGFSVHVGNVRLMERENIPIHDVVPIIEQLHDRALTPLLVAVDSKVIGVLAYEDTVRPESAQVVEELRQHGVREILLLTGDNHHTAAAVAAKLHVDRFVAEAFPEDKARIVQDLQ
ncbi:MAG: heavy metal translocating P-type ATPase, partial [Abditibacteriales bacterium]|nr:heavy metal translocating P-type ATPase [Abditibacteriales bacterium]MDW8366997.1 heavy metal translocating P-type ATPase [Abditibacteriales bacterium]